MNHKPNTVSFVILTYKDKYIFQHRDNIPSITSPNLFAGFGGHLEGNEEPLEGLMRELREETDIDTDKIDIEYLGKLFHSGGAIRHVFAAEVPSTDFEVFEGQGKVIFTKPELEKIDPSKFAETTYKAIVKYILEN